MEKKMTYAVAIDKAIEAVGAGEVADRLTDLKAVLAKRAEKRSEKKDTAQEQIKTEIASVLGLVGKPVTVTEILAQGVLGADVSAQRVSAMLKKMVEIDGTVVKTIDKKKSYFSLAVKAEDEVAEGTDSEE